MQGTSRGTWCTKPSRTQRPPRRRPWRHCRRPGRRRRRRRPCRRHCRRPPSPCAAPGRPRARRRCGCPTCGGLSRPAAAWEAAARARARWRGGGRVGRAAGCTQVRRRPCSGPLAPAARARAASWLVGFKRPRTLGKEDSSTISVLDGGRKDCDSQPAPGSIASGAAQRRAASPQRSARRGLCVGALTPAHRQPGNAVSVPGGTRWGPLRRERGISGPLGE
jgi:hypothetical protein